jgi:hypothetical protein
MPAKSSSLITAVLAAVLPLLPSRLAAQAVADSAGVRLDVSADASLAMQRLGGGTLATIGGRLWLTFPAGWRLGVGGVRGLNRIAGGVLDGSGLDARFGAGSVGIAVPLPALRGLGGLEARFAVGSGAVYLDNALLGTTVDTETVWTVEPSVLWRGREYGRVRVGGEAGYRWILGSEGLSRLDAGDLRTFTLAIVVSFPAS